MLVQGVLCHSCSWEEVGSIYCWERGQFPLLLPILMLAGALIMQTE